MPECPICHEYIDHLNHYRCGREYSYYTGENYNDHEFNGDGDVGFECPDCGADVFNDEDNAQVFLNQDNEDNPLGKKTMSEIEKLKFSMDSYVGSKFSTITEGVEDKAEFLQSMQDNELDVCDKCDTIRDKRDLKYGKLGQPTLCSECLKIKE